MINYTLLATESLKLGHYDSAIHFYNHAYLVCRHNLGEFDVQTA
jgi:hypothetical protein